MTIRAALVRVARILVPPCLAAPLLLAAPPADALKCPIFPPGNPLNQRVDTLPVHPRSAD
jgi:hypothetical protein